ncbi:hypothetical protein LEP1GSC170_4999 [Leptospira interrogans serovar Bataviae str. HAI135]|nr:hypothetical protein LEP1GSC170_4999 [Leptospira interrogans serovar Bataviae str. HAI135]
MFVDRVFVVSSYILRKNFDFSSGSYTLKLWDKIKIFFLPTILFSFFILCLFLQKPKFFR